ncbi:MAG: hypothetical protein K2Y22_16465 [Candidatus Obscuribacterales bacterium]|nr:hypothetical protein [Candidatus Obscuribacterales bacterium]
MIQTADRNKVYVAQNGVVTAIKYPDDCVRLFHHDDNGHVDKLFELRWRMQEALCALYIRDERGKWLVGWDHPDKDSIYEFKETQIRDLNVTPEGFIQVFYDNGSILRGTSYQLQ